MNTERTALYEGMFLFPQSATANLQAAIDHLKEVLEKCDVSIINFSKWDDRRLAYEIEGNKRGVYFLVYFNAPTKMIADLERRCNQSEEIIRMMVTRAENLPTEIIEANEGAQALADEIKVRGEQKTEKGINAASTVSRKEAAPKPAEAKEEAPAEAEAVEGTKEAAQTEETEEVTDA
ncbi:MAG: 30S ribosomal protein S6 [Phycisphaerales bacterium]|nr:30S ribosomal protein S6 [Phycisphaerales bacterium]